MQTIKKPVLIALVLFAGAVAGRSQTVTAPLELVKYPEMVIYNGKILTMDDVSFTSNVGTVVQAIAVRDGKVFKIGNNAEIQALAGPQTQKVDLKGRTVVPGFSMTHEHPVDWMWTEPLAYRHVFPNDDVMISRFMPSKPAKEQFALFEPAMKAAVAKAKPGQWIRMIPNWGPDYEWADQFEGRGECCTVWEDLIKKEYLDTLAPNNPVCISDGFTSSCQLNTKGLEEYATVHSDLSNRNRQTGWVGRKTPSDVILKGKVPMLAELLKSEMELWALYGVTAYGSAPYAYTNLQALNIIDQRGDMPARYAWTWHDAVAPKGWDLDTLRHLSGMLGQGSDYLWFIGAFGEAGGCFSIPERAEFAEAMKAKRGANWDGDPCSNAPGTEGYTTNVSIAQAGLRIATMHSDGDRGIDYVMDAIEEGSKKAGLSPEQIRSKRHTFDHGAGAPRPAQIPRIKNLGMMTSMINTILWENHRGASLIAKQYGLEYTNWVVPRKSVTEAGIMNSFEIDRPLPHKLFFFVTKGMNRYNDKDKREYGPGEKTDRVTQLKALTNWGGYYTLRENKIGMLKLGSYADFLVLDRDYLTIPEADIPKIEILMTVVGGRPIHLGATLAREIGSQPVGPSTWPEPIPEGWEPKPY